MQLHHHLDNCPSTCNENVFVRFGLVLFRFILHSGQTRSDMDRSLKETLHWPTVLPDLNRNRKAWGFGRGSRNFCSSLFKCCPCNSVKAPAGKSGVQAGRSLLSPDYSPSSWAPPGKPQIMRAVCVLKGNS